jgi:hypothetical protein
MEKIVRIVLMGPVALHSVFVRDQKRRLRLVIDLLELEAGRPGTLPLSPMA